MSQIFNLPDVGEGLTEAEILAWKVAPGDTVHINDVLVEIETAKSVVELPSPYEGTVEQLLAAEGDTVEVGTPIIAVAGSSESAGSSAPATPGANTGAAETPEAETGNQPLVGSGPKADSVKRRARKRICRPTAAGDPRPAAARPGGAHARLRRAACRAAGWAQRMGGAGQ